MARLTFPAKFSIRLIIKLHINCKRSLPLSPELHKIAKFKHNSRINKKEKVTREDLIWMGGKERVSLWACLYLVGREGNRGAVCIFCVSCKLWLWPLIASSYSIESFTLHSDTLLCLAWGCSLTYTNNALYSPNEKLGGAV